MAIAVATAAGVRAFSVRKEPKGHGVGGRFAGPVAADDRVLAVEDTVTTGGSFLKAVDAIEELGCEIVAAVCLLDRGDVLSEPYGLLTVIVVPSESPSGSVFEAES